MKVVVHQGSRGLGNFLIVRCEQLLVLANLYLTWDEIRERNLVPNDFNGGDYGCLFLPSRHDHHIVVSERLDNTRLVGSYSVCFKHGVVRFGWYYRHGDDLNEVHPAGHWDTPTGCEDLRSALLEAVTGHRRGKGD